MSDKEEQTFSIHTHDLCLVSSIDLTSYAANDPNNDPALHSDGLRSAAQAAHEAKPGPQILSSEQASRLEEPLSKDELAKRSAELNQ
ncbi:hypothetical protein K437DRAFT_269345 [Tilletiaria anomala UBC 951]|uniref:Uncharacterized protein n=1 Tax=Tilletiaria anomala (strain ATCC 24038 / CBS 436.72 / UBC 951) TaxID=1037660 RepID=A0A066VVM3_TILAU|nr:uncharacterized protein K437DRAFT_269345 [Tilletiaria anomala UBC 951]KDN42615.1 hypothetical protein K437DRAFT_269345 [Tilletiaria anomala UBC 951]